MTLTLTSIAIVLGSLALAAPAGASNAYLDEIFGCGGPPRLDKQSCDTGGDWYQGFFTARPGETNDVRVSRAGGAVTVADQGSTVSGPAGKQGSDFKGSKQCAPGVEHTVACDVSTANTDMAENGYLSAGLALGDGNDKAQIDAGVGPVAGYLDIEGGAGNDTIGVAPVSRIAYLFGDSGDDRITGGNGPDTIYGGKGRDRVSAGNGDDDLFLKDGERDNADCGAGRGTVRADRGDRLHRCEKVRRG